MILVNTKPNLKLITAVVLALHLLLIFYSYLFFYTPVYTPPKREKLLVKTVKLSPPKAASAPATMPAPAIEEPIIAEPDPIPVIESEPEPVIPIQEEPVNETPKEPEAKIEAQPAPPPPKPIPKALPKPKPKPAPVIKKPAPKPVPKKKDPAPVKKDTAPPKPNPKKEVKKEIIPDTPKVDPQAEALKQKKRALLDQARNVASKVDTNASKLKGGSSLEKINIPAQLGELKIDNLSISTEESLNVRERGYSDELASRLKLTLKLPEYGVVRLKLTLNRLGKVIDVTILQSESGGNKTHIKKTLPGISFPSFGDNFIGHESYTFQITLKSE